MHSIAQGRATRLITTMRSRLTRACALALLTAVPARAAGAPPLDESGGALRVCAEGPGAALARAERLRGEAAVTAAGVLPNPSLLIENQRTLSGPAEEETSIGLAVPLQLSGRRSLLQDAAAARREQALADAHATLLEAALAFRAAYAAAAADEARLAALAGQQASLDALATTIEGLVRGGESAGYDRLRHATQARLHRRLVEAARGRAAASRALLEAWTGEEVTLPAVDLTRLAGGSRPHSAAPSAPAGHPQIRGLEAAARVSDLEARAARRRWVPDVEVFVGYRALASAAREAGHGISLALTVPLTFFDHGQGDAARADAERAAAEAAGSGLKRDRAARAKASAARLAILEASAADLDRTAAEVDALEAQARRLYAAGEASVAELLDAFRAAEEARLARVDLAQEIALARLERMRAEGTQLDPSLDSACGAIAGGAR